MKDHPSTDPASPAPRCLVQRAQREIAATGHIADDTCLRLIQQLPALSDDEQWTLIGTLAHRRAQPPPLDPKRN